MPTWAILGPLAPKIYSESAFMTSQNKKAQVLDPLGLFRFLSGRGERIRTSGLYVHCVVLLVGADELHVDDLQLVRNGHDQPVVITLMLNTTRRFFSTLGLRYCALMSAD